jgi:hypothetical protein
LRSPVSAPGQWVFNEIFRSNAVLRRRFDRLTQPRLDEVDRSHGQSALENEVRAGGGILCHQRDLCWQATRLTAGWRETGNEP